MFDGVDLPGLRLASPSQLELLRTHTINRGLRGWWPLEDASVRVARDISGYGNHATVVTGTPTRTRNRVGAAVRWASGGGYFQAANFAWPANSPISVSFWNGPESGDSGAFSIGSGEAAACWAPYGGTLYWDYPRGATSRLTASYTAGGAKLSHILLEADGAGYHAIWIDGILKSSNSGTDAATTALTGLNIGRYLNGGGSSFRSISNFRIWNRMLALGEKQDLVRQPWIGSQRAADRLFFVALKPSSGLLLTLSGEQIAASAGTVAAGISTTIDGGEVASGQGSLSVASEMTIAGAALTIAGGTLSPGIGVAISGSAITSAAGSIGYAATLSVSGSAIGSALGSVAADNGTVSVALRGEVVAVLPGNVRVRGGTRWVEPAAQAMALPSTINNTLPPPPRLTGNPQIDVPAQNQWLSTLYDRFIKEMNALGRLSDHETRIARLENPDDT